MKDIKEKLKVTDKKKLILVAVFFVVIIIILFGGAIVYNKFFYKRSYTEVESIMLTTAKKHMSSHKDKLPANINDSVTLSVSDLVRLEEMKDISEYIKDDSVTCKGSITITNINHTYRYVPNLDCGTAYKTKFFIDYIKDTNPVVENGEGLYNMNDQLVYRGDNVNNYLKLSGKLYRIVKFVDDHAVIILSEKSDSQKWDDRYNVDKKSNSGINDYSVSRVKDYLESLYAGKSILGVNTETGVDSKLLAVSYSLEIGKRSDKDTDKSGGLERGAIIENQFIGLLPLYDFLNASLDKNCITSVNHSCMNYNYLSKFEKTWWTGTASSSNSYSVFYVNRGPALKSAYSTANARYVLHLAKDALYVSGTGTNENPYVVK